MTAGWLHRTAPWLLAGLPLAFLLLVQLGPAARLLVQGWWAPPMPGLEMLQASAWLPWTDPYLRARLLWTLAQAAATALLALALGLPLAWVLARWEFPGRLLVLRSVMLPFVVPTLVAALGVLALLGPQGLLARTLGLDAQGTPWLLLYGNLFFNLCLLVRHASAALEQVSAQRLAAARTLGATPWRAFWRVEWPSVLPAVLSAMSLVFLYCFSGFGLALVLGGQRHATVEVEIYTLVAHELQLQQASVLGLWSMGLCLLVAALHAGLQRRLAVPRRSDALARRRVRGWRARLALGAALLPWALVCMAPLLAIVVRAVAAGADAWAVLLEDDTRAALANTLRFGALSLVLAALLGLAHALAAQRWAWMRTLAYVPLVVSPVLVALGLLLLYPGWVAATPLLIAAYALLAYPLLAQPLLQALDAQPAHLLQAARSLGATPLRAFVRVTLPLVLPALRRGLAFAAATAVGEFAVTLFLARPEWTTLSTLVYQRLGRPGAANLDAALVLAAALMLLALVLFVLIEGRGRDATRLNPTPGAPDA